jgi:F-type H+-transporting ATPase subunit b
MSRLCFFSKNKTFFHIFLKTLITYLPLIVLLVLYGGLIYAASGGEGGTAGHEAAAGHGGETTARLLDLLYRSINFIIFLGVLLFLIRKPLKQVLTDRRESIQKELQDLEAKKEEANRELQALEKRISNIKEEQEAILTDYKAEAEKERQKIIDSAQKTASRIIDQSQITIQQEMQKANQALRQEMSDMAVRMAEDLLKKNITDNDQKVLISEYLAKVVTH